MNCFQVVNVIAYVRRSYSLNISAFASISLVREGSRMYKAYQQTEWALLMSLSVKGKTQVQPLKNLTHNHLICLSSLLLVPHLITDSIYVDVGT